MHIPTLFPLIVQQKLIIKNQVLPVVPPPPSCAIQNGKLESGKFCYSSSVTFDAKKVKETL